MISAAEWELSRQDTETQTDNIQIFVDEHLWNNDPFLRTKPMSRYIASNTLVERIYCYWIVTSGKDSNKLTNMFNIITANRT